MSQYRRNFVPGGTFFFTVVTAQRRPILTTDLGRRCLREAIHEVKTKFAFSIYAMVLLPDHFHTIWILPPEDSDFPTRMRRIKTEFTNRYLALGGCEVQTSESRIKKRERGIWQRRYWEHTVRDEDDLKHCTDYIHWNPCKHNLVVFPRDWLWSSYHRFVRDGEYDDSWGHIDPCPGTKPLNFAEAVDVGWVEERNPPLSLRAIRRKLWKWFAWWVSYLNPPYKNTGER